MPGLDHIPRPAIVSRRGANPTALEQYLQIGPNGALCWIADPQAATGFVSMGDALRVATRLPAELRAFSLPRFSEASVDQMPH
jgi:hypothetical protein